MSIKRLCLDGENPVKDSDKFFENQIEFLKMLACASNAMIQIDED